jgi:hypothetical protein
LAASEINILLFSPPFIGEEKIVLQYLKDGDQIKDVDVSLAFSRHYLPENTTLTILLRAGLRAKRNEMSYVFSRANGELSWQQKEAMCLICEFHCPPTLYMSSNPRVFDYTALIWRFRDALRLSAVRAMAAFARGCYGKDGGKNLAKTIGWAIWENRINSPE